jgi:hypothetical protein
MGKDGGRGNRNAELLSLASRAPRLRPQELAARQTGSGVCVTEFPAARKNSANGYLPDYAAVRRKSATSISCSQLMGRRGRTRGRCRQRQAGQAGGGAGVEEGVHEPGDRGEC